MGRQLRPRFAGLLLLIVGAGPAWAQTPDLSTQVEIRRTAHGIPHITAENFRAAGFALGWVQTEDYGERVPMHLARARADLARHVGPGALDSDFRALPRYRRAVEVFPRLDSDARDVYEGFAEGVNRFVQLHPERFPAWMRGDFTGREVLAAEIEDVDPSLEQRLVPRLDSLAAGGALARRIPVAGPPAGEDAGADAALGPFALSTRADDGSNAWALAPGRTRSGRAILLRNPHLNWNAGYYEAHLVVPGEVNFYGDFRIGTPFETIGGFNERLGWATTNNAADVDEVYALEADPARPDHYRFDGASVPLQREEVTLVYRDGDDLGRETRIRWSTPLGPVIHRASGTIFVHSSPAHLEWRGGMQFLRMMRAADLEEWKSAMRLRGRFTSSFTYADADGNIFYVWNATLPALPHTAGGDTTAVPVSRSEQVWTRILPWDSLPQVHNPRSGYVQNANDSPHYTNLDQVLDPGLFPPNVEPPNLRLRSQHSIQLIGGSGKVSLEDVVRLKHSPRMLLADRVKDELLAAVRSADPDPETAAAADLLERWDNTATEASRGGALFDAWWAGYLRLVGARQRPERDPRVFREPWTPAAPAETPRGLADPARAVQAFRSAMAELREQAGGWDVAWGDVFRVRRGGLDVPVSGCGGHLGCFRVLWFARDGDGRYRVTGGDGWTLAVEFTDPPRAFSILGYGQSALEDSPHHTDQVELFAAGRMRPVAFTDEDIERTLIRRYRPGEPAR